MNIEVIHGLSVIGAMADDLEWHSMVILSNVCDS